MRILEFIEATQKNAHCWFECPGSRRTVMVSSHIWWTAAMAYAIWQRGYNVVVTRPFYLAYVSDQAWADFGRHFDEWRGLIRTHKVNLVIGGNSTGILMNLHTGELLHEAASVPLVNYWWDEPRNQTPAFKRGMTRDQFLAILARPSVLNVFWDRDVQEEMTALYGLANAMHAPLATEPELWDTTFTPLAQRPVPACFLGNCHGTDPSWGNPLDPAVLDRAQKIVALHLADLDRPMMDCLRAPGITAPDPGAIPSAVAASGGDGDFALWHAIMALLNDCRRAQHVKAMKAKLGEYFRIFGRGWDKVGLASGGEHCGFDGTAQAYVQSILSLNLFGGSIHSGMPLRPYDIAASHGLVFTAYNRELPELLEPGKECVAFRTEAEMLEQVDRILSDPAAYDGVVQAGRRRVLAEHTWGHRFDKVFAAAKERFKLAW
jgi:hypothetical protein